MSDYYQILGVSRGATNAEIRSAYARLARDKHPDRFTDPVEKERAGELFKELTAAFNALGNERQRAEYDRTLDRPRPVTPEEIAAEAHAEGTRYVEQKAFPEAIDAFRRAVHHGPNEAGYHVALARALSRVPASAREAVQVFERAIQLAPVNAAYHLDLARLLASQGLKLRARKVAEAAERLAPNDAGIRRLLGELGEPELSPNEGGGLKGLLRRKP